MIVLRKGVEMEVEFTEEGDTIIFGGPGSGRYPAGSGQGKELPGKGSELSIVRKPDGKFSFVGPVQEGSKNVSGGKGVAPKSYDNYDDALKALKADGYEIFGTKEREDTALKNVRKEIEADKKAAEEKLKDKDWMDNASDVSKQAVKDMAKKDVEQLTKERHDYYKMRHDIGVASTVPHAFKADIERYEKIAGVSPENKFKFNEAIYDPTTGIATLSEDGFSWIEILREGEYRKDPKTGKGIKITAAMLAEYKKNYEAGVRGIYFDGDKSTPTLDIDYDHKKDAAKGKKAAGWFGELDIREASTGDGKKSLWMKPKHWTPDAQVAIKNGEYKGFSVEIAEDYMAEDGKKYAHVLLGGGLTNRPEVKEMVPLSLSEDAKNAKKKEDTSMQIKELCEKAGIEFTDDEAALDAVAVKLAEAAAEHKELSELKKASMAARKAAFIEKAKGKVPPAELEEKSATLSEFDKNPDYIEALVEKLPVHPEFKEKAKGKGDDGDEPDEDDVEFDKLSSESKDKKVQKFMSEKSMKPEQYSEAVQLCRTSFNEAYMAKLAKKGAK